MERSAPDEGSERTAKVLLTHTVGVFPTGIKAAAAIKRQCAGQNIRSGSTITVQIAGCENGFKVEEIVTAGGSCQEGTLICEEAEIDIVEKYHKSQGHKQIEEINLGLEALTLNRNRRSNDTTPPPGLEKIFSSILDLAVLSKADMNSDLCKVLWTGICVSGLAGSGKSLLCESLMSTLQGPVGSGSLGFDVRCLYAQGPSLLMGETTSSRNRGGPEYPVKDDVITAKALYEKAEREQPVVVFIDEMDCLLDQGPEALQAANALLSQLAKVSSSKSSIITVGFTRELSENIPAAFLQNGCFEKVVTIDAPSEEDRVKIIKGLLSALNICEENLLKWSEMLARLTPGFYGGDLHRLCSVALRGALLQTLSDPNSFGNGDEIAQVFAMTDNELQQENAELTWGDFQLALQKVKPLALAEFDVQKGGRDLSWKSVGGYSKTIQRLKQLVDGPLETPETYQRLGLSGTSGILLHGPSGCGKSLVAQVLASEARANFVWVHSTELFSKYLGETEATIRGLFKKARSSRPCILFFDELDAICANRDSGDSQNSLYSRVLSTLLNELDGISGSNMGVLVLGATNRYDALDAAILRPGRLSEHVLLGKPDEQDRVEIFKIHSSGMPLSEDVSFQDLAKDVRSQKLTGADIQSVCREAGLVALREIIGKDNDGNMLTITQANFLQALSERCFQFGPGKEFSFF
mmetsp:Transcript_32479/g.42785  ORF Transcript_32479/g.42785 Transcript_32479/m.42785 type:complete len:694 (-) Transcript_32479:57-2138(-)